MKLYHTNTLYPTKWHFTTHHHLIWAIFTFSISHSDNWYLQFVSYEFLRRDDQKIVAQDHFIALYVSLKMPIFLQLSLLLNGWNWNDVDYKNGNSQQVLSDWPFLIGQVPGEKVTKLSLGLGIWIDSSLIYLKDLILLLSLSEEGGWIFFHL